MVFIFVKSYEIGKILAVIVREDDIISSSNIWKSNLIEEGNDNTANSL
jgi:hypothetical protein